MVLVKMKEVAETFLGKALQSVRREELVLGTKVFGKMSDDVNDRGLSRKHIMASCEHSLRRLKVEVIDLYQCHRYDPETPLPEVVRAMDDLIRQGKVLYWGVSCWTAEELREACEVADRLLAPLEGAPREDAEAEQLRVDGDQLAQRRGGGRCRAGPDGARPRGAVARLRRVARRGGQRGRAQRRGRPAGVHRRVPQGQPRLPEEGPERQKRRGWQVRSRHGAALSLRPLDGGPQQDPQLLAGDDGELLRGGRSKFHVGFGRRGVGGGLDGRPYQAVRHQVEPKHA